MDIQPAKSYVPTIHKSILLGTGLTWSNSRQVCMYFGSWTGGSCATFTTWQQFSAWNDILAAIWTYDVISKVGLCQSLHVTWRKSCKISLRSDL